MPTDTDTTTELDPIEPAATDESTEPTGSTTGRSIVRAVRWLVTPVSIVVAWIVVVTQWNESDSALFNWATVTAGVVLAVVTVLWLVSLRFPALRRALLPFEGGLVVAAVVLAWATGGREVDLLGDRIAIAFAFGVIAALLLAFMQQLVAGRDRAWAWLTGVVVVCAAAGVAVPATLDWLDGAEVMPYGTEFTGELVARSSADGFRLDDITMLYDSPTLGSGYVDAGTTMFGVGYAEPAVAIDPATNEPVASSPMAEAVPVDTSMAIAADGTSVPTIRNDWARLLAQPDGSIRLSVQRAVATGVDGEVQASLRRGDCRVAADDDQEVLSFSFGRASRDEITRALPVQVDDLHIDDRMSLVVGIAEPLAPTRCIQLLSGAGVALAQLGAATFNDECLAPLDLPRGSDSLVRPSTFQDATCAKRFRAYADISTALLVPKDRLAGFRRCQRVNERGMATTERRLPHGAIAVSYPDLTAFGACTMHGTVPMSAGGFAMGSTAVGPVALPAPTGPGAADPATAAPTAPTTVAPVGPGPAGAAPVGAAPTAPGAIDPATGLPVTDDLDRLTPGELAERIR